MFQHSYKLRGSFALFTLLDIMDEKRSAVVGLFRARRQLLKNPRLSVRKLSRSMEFSNSSVHRLVRKKLDFRAFKIRKVHELTEQQKRNQLAKSKVLKKRFACQTSPNIVFSDE